MNHVAAIDVEIIRVKLKTMMAGGHLSICVVDELLKLTGGIPDARTYNRLRALHCVNFKDMTPALRIEIPRMLQLVLEAPPIQYLYQPPSEINVLELDCPAKVAKL